MNRRLRIVLVAPRIPANVGSCARTAEALGAELILVGPLGFQLNTKALKRSSVGYWDSVQPLIFRDFQHFWADFEATTDTQFLWLTKHGESVHWNLDLGSDIVLIFGNEEEGVDPTFWEYKKAHPFKNLLPLVSCRIPMQGIRCLNLAVSVGIMGYEVSRQWNLNTSPDLAEGVGDL